VAVQGNYTYVPHLKRESEIQVGGWVSPEQERDLVLAWAIGSTSNSNTITLVKDGMVIGNGVGQQDRVGAGQLALSRTTTELPKIEDLGDQLVIRTYLDKAKLDGAVAYSDSFFPFPDGPLLLAQAGIEVMLTSNGSQNDSEVFAALAGSRIQSVLTLPDKDARGFFGH
jgi:phosphoribosylaminoimidazolecarboxamide formyltransferase/IMP cyclohydrolase